MSLSDKKELRVVFMGTPDFAVTILDSLIKKSYTIVGVVTVPDKPAGRGRTMHQSAVKKYALTKDLKVLQPEKLKEDSFIADLASLEATVFVVVAFRMLPKVVWSMPKFGTFNLHASLLPQYRGAAPINWAIINGETKTGVTTFFIDDKIDTGAIILKKAIPIESTDTAGSLHDKLMHLGAIAVLETLHNIQNRTAIAQPQKETDHLHSAPKLFKHNSEIDWSATPNVIYNKVRGLCPYPVAWTSLHTEGQTIFLKVYKVGIEDTAHDFAIGTVVRTKKEMKIAVHTGFIQLLEIQLPGKRRMEIRDVLNGLKLGKYAHVG